MTTSIIQRRHRQMQKFVNTGKSLTKYDIEEAGGSINVIFPQDLVRLYLQYNGGEVDGEKYFYTDEDSDIDVSVRAFLPMKYKRSEDDILLEDMYKIFAINKQLIPTSYIPFAIDEGGYPYCINIDDERIYIGYLEDYDGSPESTIRLISHSLMKFINGLKTEEECR